MKTSFRRKRIDVKWLMVLLLSVTFLRDVYLYPQEKKLPSDISDFKAKAGIIRAIIPFCKWQKDSPLNAPNPQIVIGILEKNEIFDHYENALKTKKYTGLKTEIKYFSNLDRLNECNVLYIPEMSKKKLNEVLNRLEGLPILTISDTIGYEEKGIMVNLIMTKKSEEKSVLRFIINRTVAKLHGLDFDSRMLKLAEKIL